MPRVSKLLLAKTKIERYFDSTMKHVFTKAEINGILYEYSNQWDLSVRTNDDKLINFLIDNSYMTVYHYGSIYRYLWREKFFSNIVYEIALSLKPNSYFSHYTAMFFNNLTEQVPKTIYVTFERQTILEKENNQLSQELIDRAFTKDERESKTSYLYNNYKIVLINSPRDDRIGIKTYRLENGLVISLTNIERTLIDITVRQIYSGGIFEVIKAYENAIKDIQIVKLTNYLSKIKYIYPYEQAIGFCLEYVGLPEKRLTRIEKCCNKNYKFYLCRKMVNPNFSTKWSLYYPNTLIEKK